MGWTLTRRPEGLWVRQTAELVLLMAWPPFPQPVKSEESMKTVSEEESQKTRVWRDAPLMNRSCRSLSSSFSMAWGREPSILERKRGDNQTSSDLAVKDAKEGGE